LQNIETEQRQFSQRKKIAIYLFVGVFIGDLIITTSMFLSANSISFSGIGAYLAILVIGFPIGLITAGIPAILTAMLIEASESTKYRYSHAFCVGFLVGLLFFAMFNPQGSIQFALISGIAATSCRYLIQQLEESKACSST